MTDQAAPPAAPIEDLPTTEPPNTDSDRDEHGQQYALFRAADLAAFAAQDSS